MSNITYEGWKNYETWNVALWINNEFPLYTSASKFMQSYKGRAPYSEWIRFMGYENAETADEIKWMSKKLCRTELNQMMRELVNDQPNHLPFLWQGNGSKKWLCLSKPL